MYKHYASIPFQIEKILITKTMNPGLEDSVPTSDEVEALRAGQEPTEKRVYLQVGKPHLVMLTIYSSYIYRREKTIWKDTIYKTQSGIWKHGNNS